VREPLWRRFQMRLVASQTVVIVIRTARTCRPPIQPQPSGHFCDLITSARTTSTSRIAPRIPLHKKRLLPLLEMSWSFKRYDWSNHSHERGAYCNATRLPGGASSNGVAAWVAQTSSLLSDSAVCKPCDFMRKGQGAF